ncbi:hypothetical protein [Pseudomonas citronellolis]|uniref:hypothetical protein n=1 Tax=Pseudomonas citronellolis TaxID=53408 RepID=UPI0023E4639D|nr:hypothetical protein [Pseudomonas citronellolis]MDF3931374.1 hypothetical protein [Pseudomonas citronellolis]
MEQADWDALEAQMARPYGCMKLKCDQFEVAFQQQTDNKSKSWFTAVYVDGYFKGAWMQADGDKPKFEEARRFLRKESRRVYSAKEVEQHRKIFGKREAKRLEEKRWVMFQPTWKSFNSLKKQLLATCTSIQRVE